MMPETLEAPALKEPTKMKLSFLPTLSVETANDSNYDLAGGGTPYYLEKNFNEQLKDYRSCCNSCHCKRAFIGIAVVEVLCHVAVVISAILEEFPISILSTFIVSCVVTAVTVSLAFYSLFRVCPYLLIPGIVVQLLRVVLLLSLTIYCLVQTNNHDDSTNPPLPIHVLLLSICSLVIGIPLEIWFFRVYRRCYIYVSTKRKFLSSNFVVDMQPLYVLTKPRLDLQ